ncbi:hypothetical protein [uncultured Thiodictyon sp.]|uniref:hypothetical protein n=1 Tax=uncultured Thiodictyon sp. TaxID=1846217 RepID=UPI0025D7078A|nr:hypothetical protein [uncultured Thiodictyon sp.]
MAKKQAVVLIHGIGEQIPMETLRGFVDAVWSKDTAIHHPYGAPTVWSKPDDISGSFELRRLTTGRNRAEVRTDFFEFYWAYLGRDTRMAQVTAWLRLLVLRPPSRIPAPLRPIWWLLAGSVLAVLVTLYAYGMPKPGDWIPVPAGAIGLAGGLLSALAGGFLVKYIGDAARYLHGAPDNVEHRQKIRTKGVELLKKLQDSGQYQRILVVGHSLGSVIGYDILTYLWATRLERPPAGAEPQTAALDRLVELARAEPFDAATYRQAQGAYLKELQANGSPWLITDFITLGSPLAYAGLLLAKGPEDLAARQADRELPTCPPALEDTREGRTFAHRSSGWRGARWIPHHAAPFAPTRWTNLYFPTRFLVRGDPIGGPLAPVFGQGIRDLAVQTPVRRGFFGHTRYWTLAGQGEATSAVVELRRALDLAGDQGTIAAEGAIDDTGGGAVGGALGGAADGPDAG